MTQGQPTGRPAPEPQEPPQPPTYEARIRTALNLLYADAHTPPGPEPVRPVYAEDEDYRPYTLSRSTLGRNKTAVTTLPAHSTPSYPVLPGCAATMRRHPW